MLSAENLTFRYPTKDEPALRDVTVRVDTGEVLGVLGPVEAGKTTLANVLASFAPQNTGGSTDGEVTVAGRDPREADDNAVAMVFEDYSAQLTQVRVIDEVIAPLVNRGLSRTEATSRARDLLDRVRLADEAEKFTWDLSGGQQQRLALAAALAIDPAVLIFDTATDMLDPEGRENVSNLIASQTGSKTMVVTANDPDDLVGIADEVLVLEKGGGQATVGPAERVLRDRELLHEVGVDAPMCLEIATRLGIDGAPLTPAEFADCLPDQADQSHPTTAREAAADGDGTQATDAPTNVDVCEATYEYADGTVAVNGVDLNVYDGEVHAVIGGNGAGKSTFSRLLVGLLNPDTGCVQVSGTDTSESTAADMATTIGVALQNPSKQLSEQTVEAELRFPLEKRQYERTGLFSLSKEQRYDDAYIDDRVETVRELVDIDEDLLEEDPMFLPQGKQRLVTMALALATDPDAVVLDEPIAGLDAENRQIIRETIEKLKADGKAIVLIDHDMDFVASVADRVTVLSDGQAVRQGPPTEIFAPEHWEWLAEHHMRPPRVTRLAQELGVEAFTPDELVTHLSARLEEAV